MTTAPTADAGPGRPAPTVALADGHTIPAITLGTWLMDDDTVARAVVEAVADGYRHIDTAMRYHNEEGVGRGLRECGLPRDQVAVTSKLRGGDHGYDGAMRAFKATKRNLGLGPVDLYFIHWPLPKLDQYVETWRALIELRDAGEIRSIGVSNFTPAHLQRLIDETGEAPVVNQVELHPGWRQDALREYCAEKGIVVQAWGPLSRGKGLLELPQVADTAAAVGVSPARVVLRWLWQLDIPSVPKSADPARRRENLDIFGFELDEAQMRALSSMPQERYGKDPDVHEEY